MITLPLWTALGLYLLTGATELASISISQLFIPVAVLTLIMASIVYWQAKENNRVIQECDPIGVGIDLTLLEHISPVSWDNIVLYGEYVLDRKLVRA